MRKTTLLLGCGLCCFVVALLLTMVQFPNGYLHIPFWIRNPWFWYEYILMMSFIVILYIAAFCCVTLAFLTHPYV